MYQNWFLRNDIPLRSNKKQKLAMGGDACEYCDGTVRERLVKREVFRQKKRFSHS